MQAPVRVVPPTPVAVTVEEVPDEALDTSKPVNILRGAQQAQRVASKLKFDPILSFKYCKVLLTQDNTE